MATASEGLMLRRVMARAGRSACFRADDYQALHPDLSGVVPLAHYAEHGVWEGRAAITPEHFASRMSRAATLTEVGASESDQLERGYRQALNARPTLYLPGDADEADHRLANRIVAALDAVAVSVPLEIGLPTYTEKCALLVHPHRLFPNSARSTPEQVIDAVVVVTETPRAETFRAQLPFLFAARGVITTEPSTYAFLMHTGIPAALLTGRHFDEVDEPQPVSHPLFKGLTRDIRNAAPGGWSERPIDVVALEPTTPLRISAWSRMAAAMAGRRTIVYPPPGALPESEETAMRRYLYQRSKLVLHLHGGEPASLDAQLIEEVAAAGAVLISEPSPPHLIVRPGVHYFEASARRMPALADDLLATDAGREAAQAAVRATRRALAQLQDPELTGLAIARLFGEPER